MENVSPQDALARLAARRAANAKGGKTKSAAQLCQEKEAAARKLKKSSGVKKNDTPKGNSDSWAVSH